MSTPSPVFSKVPSSPQFPAIEHDILALWERLDAFQESNRRRAGNPPFVFYDGPPFATGTPHYGHLLAGTIKDIVPRFWNMRGHPVERRFGWDCHGLPIENLAQKALNLNGTPEIRTLGIGQFNEQCRSMVQTYVAEWRKTITRMGRWVDFDRDYKTMDRDYMESVWWVFKRLWDTGRVYKAHRVMPYSPRLTTPLSNFEAGSNYKDVQDPAVTVKFRIVRSGTSASPSEISSSVAGQENHGATTFGSSDADAQDIGCVLDFHAANTYILAWTTTPWTLPENLALCVGLEIEYSIYYDDSTHSNYIIASAAAKRIFDKNLTALRLLGTVTGVDLLQWEVSYEPLFPYFASTSNAFRILADNFVTTGDGTGIVHLAPAYGEDDYRVCRRAGIDLVDPLDEEAKFTDQVPEYAGQFCKDADKAIIKRLKDEGKLVHQSTIVHSYPFCERTDTPLIYRAIEAWYVKVEDLRDKMAANNVQIRWVPESVGANRFGNWLKDAKDWNISRNRFWGSCLPIWINVSDPADRKCIGSVAELEQLAGLAPGSVTDLHKHNLDQIEIHEDGKIYKRTPEVLDCWFESGAMPYAQVHWMGGADGTQAPPVFPAQFIAEGLDQTRGWFYTLLVLSTALFDRPAFQNVVVNGLILAEDGAKMSKSKKNYPDPNLVLETHGADALRAYLIDSPVVRAEPLRFSEAGLKEIVRTVVLPYWNALGFFTTYASVDAYDPRTWTARPVAQRHVLDRWVLSVLQSLIRDVNAEMEAYRLYNVVPRLVAFIDDLTNWYIRANRTRFWRSTDRADQTDAYATLYTVLTQFAKVLAPFMPFLTEEAYQRLVRPVDAAAPASVHWCDYPQPTASLIDSELEAQVAVVRSVVALGRKLREDHKLKVRQPLATLTVVSRDPSVRAAAQAQAVILMSELNIKTVAVSADEAAVVAVSVKPNLKVLGKRCGPKLKEVTATLTAWGHAEVVRLEAGDTITVAGEAITAADVLLQRTPVAGAVVASAGAVTVTLDTALTPTLVAEGLAREFVSALQQARKDAGLEVADRIRVTWSSPDAEVAAALRTHSATISDEVLATAFSEGEGTITADLNGRPVNYTLAKH